SAWPPSTPTRCVTSSRMPGRCACRSAWPRSTPPRGDTRSIPEWLATPRGRESTPVDRDDVNRLGDSLERHRTRLRCRILRSGADSGLACDDLPTLGQGRDPRRLVNSLAAKASLDLRGSRCMQPDAHLRREAVLG